jgi:ribosomal protein L7/L12
MLAADGQVLLADFGIAKRREDNPRTPTGTVVGSPEYMAPERFGAGSNADGPAGDLFSLGVTLFETVEGFSPFRRASMDAVLAAVALEPHPPLRNAGALTALIERLLAKKPEHRPTAGDALATLKALSTASTTIVEDHFDVVLESAGDKKIEVIKAIFELTPLGLRGSKDLVLNAPGTVLETVSATTATRAEIALQRLGATVTVRPTQRVWRHDETASYDVILDSAGDKMIQLIKAIRQLTPLGLSEAKALTLNAPSTVLETVTAETAAKAESALTRAGATVTVRLTQGGR